MFELRLGIRQETGAEVLHFLVGRFVVDHDALGVRVGEVADHADRQRQLRVERRRSLHLFLADLDVVPDGRQVADVGFEVFVARSLARCPDDEAQILGADPIDAVAQPTPLAFRADPARDADPGCPGREDEMSAGNRDMGRDAGALAADRILGDLDHDLLALLQEGVDLGRLAAAIAAVATPATASSAPPTGLGLVVPAAVVVAVLVPVVADVEERRLLQANVDESRLHAGQDPGDPTQCDHSGHAAVAVAFDVQFGEVALFQDCDTGFPRGRVDQDFTGSGRLPRTGILHSSRLRRWRAVSGRLRVARRPRGPACGGVIWDPEGAARRPDGRGDSVLPRNSCSIR